MTDQHLYLESYCGDQIPTKATIKRQCAQLISEAVKSGYSPRKALGLRIPADGLVTPLPSPRDHPMVRVLRQYCAGYTGYEPGYYLRIDIKWQE